MEHQRNQTSTYYKKFAEFVGKYEAKMLETYVTDDWTSRVSMFHEDVSPSEREKLNLKHELNKMSDKMSNPFIWFKYWIKEETLDLHCLLEAISWMNAFIGWKMKLQSKIKSAQSSLDKLNQGKKTLATIFKSDSSRADEITRLTHYIAQAEKDVQNLDKLVQVTTVNICKIVLPSFKR